MGPVFERRIKLAMCLSCAEGFPELCETEGQCSKSTPSAEPSSLVDILSGDGFSEVEPKRKARDSRRVKNDMNLKDPQSTGRHRAVAIHGKANPEEACEWRGLANCGGGEFSILGCTDGVQENLHHGPDKNTLNNERENIHKICSQCHNRWHTLNDPGYQWDGHHKLHSPTTPTEVDIRTDAEQWKTKAVKVAKE